MDTEASLAYQLANRKAASELKTLRSLALEKAESRIQVLEEALELCRKMLIKRVKVEEELWLVVVGKSELPDKEKCRDWAQRLGIPDEQLAAVHRIMEKKV